MNERSTPSDQALTLRFTDIDVGDIARVGGKGANLGSLTRAGIAVPPGFCVTTTAFDRFIAGLADRDTYFARLDTVDGESLEPAREAATAMRNALADVPIPDEVRAAIIAALGAEADASFAYAVRSSATAEDLPGASFAGQQDTYLNIRGTEAVLDAVKRCWISLFTDRAVLYRARSHFGHREVRLSVVVQRLVDPDVSGILFTADPVSGHRHVVSIDAGFGLGEALVSGLISADLYKVDRRRREVIEAKVGDKAIAIRSTPGGGTTHEQLPASRRKARTLTDAQALALADLGARVEAHYGGVPQDIEWCIADGAIYLVQSRPITSLFPVPQRHDLAAGDDGLRIFISFGHVQMMLDPMPRMAIEAWQLILPAAKHKAPDRGDAPLRSPVLVPTASRIYIDLTAALRIDALRPRLTRLFGFMYEQVGRNVQALTERPEFVGRRGNAISVGSQFARILGPVLGRVPLRVAFGDPTAAAAAFDAAVDSVPRDAVARIEAHERAGARVHQCAVELNAAFGGLRPWLASLVSGLIAHGVLVDLAQQSWADGVRDDVETLRRGLPGNVTTEMDLAVGDLTDLVRPHPDLATLVKQCDWPTLRMQAANVVGGAAFVTAFTEFLARYGMRGNGEIDLSRSRWNDDPALLLRVISGGLASGELGAHRRQHAAQRAAGEAAAERIIAAAPAGKRLLVTRLTRVARAAMGLRETPKFIIVRLLGIVRNEALRAGEQLVAQGRLARAHDVFHLGFDELERALDDASMDVATLVAERIAAFERDRLRKPPIVISSDGETPTLTLDRKDLPANALPGTAASAGVVEGIARVITDPTREVVHAGEILVAPFTDPGWTPLFVHAAGVVTEVGGLMTHGAVVAREYGIPAVVSVDGAVSRIKSGQRIRVDGTRGFVEILEAP